MLLLFCFMTYKEIIDKAKMICYPAVDSYNGYKTSIDIEASLLLKKHFPHKEIDLMFGVGPVYKTWPLNNHHFVIPWQQSNIAPAILRLFDIEFSLNDFNKIAYFVQNESTQEMYDLSYMMPKEEQRFSITDIETGTTVEQNSLFRDYNDNNCREQYATSYYHYFLWCTHKCALIRNNSLPDGKSIVISCDSQMAPVVPVLACYFKEILHLDRRKDYDISKYLEKEYDYVLVAHWSTVRHSIDGIRSKMFINFQHQCEI